MKTAIFLGAGASAAEGAPLQNQIFKEYFKSVQISSVNKQMEEELTNFFYLIFNIDFQKNDLDNIVFPTFEEALGILDFAEERKESLRGLSLNKIPLIREYLIFAMAHVLDNKLTFSNGKLHNLLIKNLIKKKKIKETVFVSTNYDILIDNALTKLFPDKKYDDKTYMLDYTVDFTNFHKKDDWKKPTKNKVHLYKIHGSLNWLYCPTCRALTLTPKEKGVIQLITKKIPCSSCDSQIVPIIIPPTFYKDMSNKFLTTIWNNLEETLKDVNHFIFCGYSFPDADMHVKYLIKRIQNQRRGKMYFTIINNHKNKKKLEKNNEESRFKRFLGNSVFYKNNSFEAFCKNPIKFYNLPKKFIY